MTIPNEWCVAVFKCRTDSMKKVLVEVYKFVDDLKGVRSLHFLVRDRVEDEVVVSFRVMVEPKFKETIKTNLACKLGTLLSEDKYVIDRVLFKDTCRAESDFLIEQILSDFK